MNVICAKSPLPPAAVSDERHFSTEHLRGDLAGRSVRGGVATAAGQAGRFSLNLLSVVVMARLLSPVEYGLVAMVAPITGFVSLFKDLGLSTATVQRGEVTHGQVSVLFWINVTVSVVLAACCAAVSPLVGRFYGDARTMWITLALASSFIVGGLTAQHHALLKRQMRFGALAGLDLVSSLAGTLAGIATALMGWGYWALVAMTLTAAIANCIGVWVVNSWRPGRPRRGTGVYDMVHFGGCLTVSQVCGYISGNADKLVIGRLMGAAALGIYNRAFQLLAMPLDQVFSPLSSVLLAALSRVSDDPPRYRRAIRRIGDLLLMAITPLSAVSIALAGDTVAVLLGSQWIAAVPVFRALAVVAIALPMNYLGVVILQSAGRTDVMMRWAPVSMFISIASILAGIPWGITGIAYGWAICGLVVRTPVFYTIIGRTTHTTFGDLITPVLFYVAPFLAIVFAGPVLCTWMDFGNPVLNLLVHGTILFAGYGFYLLLTGRVRVLLELVRQGRKGVLP